MDPYDFDSSSSNHQPQQATAPAKPLAPYALFFRDTMTAIKQQNPSCTLEQITSIAGNMWESLDDKQKLVYDQRHEVEKREYVRQMRDYQRQLSETPTVEPPQQEQQQQQQQPLTEQLPAHGVADENQDLKPAPEQIQLLTEAAAVQKCTRDQCTKPAIINPDWEDEYCSNECVVIHCRNVFTEWASSLQNAPT
ncbi:TOX high mobility group box family member 4 isoform X3 [Drosophila busckii]|nr:TOX high mobility group box family member 4 isoform X3 [Drosophila busckii]